MEKDQRIKKGIEFLSIFIEDLQRGGDKFFENRNGIISIFFKNGQLHEDFVEIIPSGKIGGISSYLWSLHMSSSFSKSDCSKYINNLKMIRSMLMDANESNYIIESRGPKMNNKIFISHSSKDIKYVKAVVEMLEDIGLGKDQIFCSSFPEYGIPAGNDIYEYLKKQFEEYNLKVIFILSDNYYESPASLNEMGAAWILKNDALSILVPGFEVDKIKGCVNKNEIAIRLDANESELYPRLNEFKEKIDEEFKLDGLAHTIWERKRGDFVKKINDSVKDKN